MKLKKIKNWQMLKNSFEKQLISIFKKKLRIKNFKKNSQKNIYVIWDSLSNLNILLQIEKEFSIKFNSLEFNSLNSFKEIYSNVYEKIRKRSK